MADNQEALAEALVRSMTEAGVKPEQLLAGLLRAAQQTAADSPGRGRIADLPDDALLRSSEVEKLLGVSRVTIWRMVRRGEFPKPLKLTAGHAAWRLSEVRAHIAKAAERR